MIAIVLIVYLVYADAAFFSESVALFTLLTVFLFVILSIKSGRVEHRVSILNLIFVVVTGAVATAVFWLRAWMHMPGGLFVELFFNLFNYAFWWPGVLYGSLIRHPGERWVPSSKKRFFQYCGAGFAGGVIGFITAHGLNEWQPGLIEAAEAFLVM